MTALAGERQAPRLAGIPLHARWKLQPRAGKRWPLPAANATSNWKVSASLRPAPAFALANDCFS